MAAIRQHLPEQVAFDQGAISAMSQAFEEACNALGVFAGDARGREAIATRIIDLASRGVVDVAVLRDRVMSEVHALREN
jgi:hypothetical protein